MSAVTSLLVKVPQGPGLLAGFDGRGARSAPAQVVQRAQILRRASCGESASAIAARVDLNGEAVRKRP
jgi:hypothetical protein